MIKTWVNKGLILAYITLFCFLGISTKVDAERLYILDNIVTCGDFECSNPSTYWPLNIAGSITIENGMFKDFTTTTKIAYQNYNFIDGHTYYVSYYYDIERYQNGNVGFLAYNTNTALSRRFAINTLSTGIYENRFTISGSSFTSIWFGVFDSGNADAYLDNFILIDLTALFGSGYEPSLTDFKLYYLPDLDYFDTFNSFEPDMTTSITDVNYANIQENLTGIDYTKSIIDNDGKNVDLDLSLYFYDTVVNGVTIPGTYTAIDYQNANHPTMKYNNEIYTLNWVFADYSQRVLILELTDEQELILKKILFNRYIDRDNEYFNFKAETGFFSYAKMWFTIGSKFDLLVDVKSFLLSRETITQNDFNIINEMYIKTYDTDDNLLLPSLKMNIADLFRTVYVDDFGSQYTNISKFNFEFLITSPDTTDDYTEEEHYFYEIGIFSSDKVLHPSFIESDIDSLWDMKTCDWYQIGCHLSNFANDALTTTYNRMNIDAIIAFFDGIIDDVTQVVDTVPSGVKTVFTVLFAGLGVALIIVIIEKMNR